MPRHSPLLVGPVQDGARPRASSLLLSGEHPITTITHHTPQKRTHVPLSSPHPTSEPPQGKGASCRQGGAVIAVLPAIWILTAACMHHQWLSPPHHTTQGGCLHFFPLHPRGLHALLTSEGTGRAKLWFHVVIITCRSKQQSLGFERHDASNTRRAAGGDPQQGPHFYSFCCSAVLSGLAEKCVCRQPLST